MNPQIDVPMLQVKIRWELACLRSSRRRMGAILSTEAALIVLFILCHRVDPDLASHTVSLLYFLGWVGLIGLLACYESHCCCRDRLRTVVQRLIKCDSVHTVPELTDVMTHGDSDSSRAATVALIQLLPQVRAADTCYWDTQCMPDLYRALQGYDPALILAVLGFIEEYGEASAYAHVIRLMLRAGWPFDGRTIRDSAGNCIEALRRRAKERAEFVTLLRTAKRPASARNSLVRAVPGIALYDNQQLLRATVFGGRTANYESGDTDAFRTQA
jgi:hypothetical protein